MPNPLAKPNDVLCAQLAAFADQYVGRNDDPTPILLDRQSVFGGLRQLACEPLADIYRLPEGGEVFRTPDGTYKMRPPDEPIRVAAAADYIGFLRSVAGSADPQIEGRVELMRAYEPFREAVARLKQEVAGLSDPSMHPAFLGAGAIARVFVLEIGGRRYAARMPDTEAFAANDINSYISGGIAASGIPAIEKIIAASYEAGVTIAELMPGSATSKLTTAEIESIRSEHLGGLVDTIMMGLEHDLRFDLGSDNIFYDPDVGFGILDVHYGGAVGYNQSEASFAKVFGRLVVACNTFGNKLAGKQGLPNRAHYYTYDLPYAVSRLKLLECFRTVVAHRLSGERRDEALRILDTEITQSALSIRCRSDRQWVAEQVALAGPTATIWP